jgi:3-oxo-4,17-pregnadiene-20-carboxyl-CoA hydratase beta subunit
MSQLYFEDVNVDDELPPVEKLPTEEQAIEYFGRDNPTNPAFSDAEAGRRIGVGGALVPGNLKLTWLVRFVSDWAGTEGQVLGLRAVFRRPDVAGRPITLAGRVVDKRQEDGRNVVELEVVTLAEGDPSVRGSMQVQLPSRPS